MVTLLNDIFSTFDEMSERYGVEKIKTIGDAYMAVGGLNAEHGDYTRDMANMALEMREYLASNPALSRYKLGVHTGIATGPVFAGVIGTKRFIYDLWGDTVNVASRLTNEALPGVIQVDKVTHHRICHDFDFGPQITVSIKGKGEMVAYQLISKIGYTEALCTHGSGI